MTDTKTVRFPKDQFVTLCNMFQLMAIAGLKLHGTGSAIPSDVKINAIWNTLRNAALDEIRFSDAGPMHKDVQLNYIGQVDANDIGRRYFKLDDLVSPEDMKLEDPGSIEFELSVELVTENTNGQLAARVRITRSKEPHA